jgi:hypothetical protein
MKTFVILGLTALAAAACQDATSPEDTADLDGGLASVVVGTSTVSLVDALGAATPATQFSVFGGAGWAIASFQFVGPEFILNPTDNDHGDWGIRHQLFAPWPSVLWNPSLHCTDSSIHEWDSRCSDRSRVIYPIQRQ